MENECFAAPPIHNTKYVARTARNTFTKLPAQKCLHTHTHTIQLERRMVATPRAHGDNTFLVRLSMRAARARATSARASATRCRMAPRVVRCINIAWLHIKLSICAHSHSGMGSITTAPPRSEKNTQYCRFLGRAPLHAIARTATHSQPSRLQSRAAHKHAGDNSTKDQLGPRDVRFLRTSVCVCVQIRTVV